MKIGLVTNNSGAWCSTKLVKAIEKRGFEPVCFKFSDLMTRIASSPRFSLQEDQDVINVLEAILIRPIGPGSLDEVIFRLDILHRMERMGLNVINPPSAIEKAVDKYYALTLLEEKGLPVPRTIVVEDPRKALKAFRELGCDVVVKPLFGSRGLGITRVTDKEVAYRIFHSLSFIHHVLYLQEYIPHENRDIRAFVVGDRVIAAMTRVAEDWKTNVSQGAKPVALKPSAELRNLAVKAARALGCEVAGVDLMEGVEGYLINELNSQPGFRALQSVTEVDIAGSIIDHVLNRASL